MAKARRRVIASVQPMPARVHQRPDTGSWRVVQWRDGKRTTKDYPTEEKARAVAAALDAVAESDDHYLDDDGLYLTSHALRGWFEKHRETLSKSYRQTASGLIERHLIPHFGSTPLPHIHPERVTEFVARTMDAGKSSATALNALSLLRRVAQLYVEAGLIDRNPLARAGAAVAAVARQREPAVRRVSAWTREEADRLLGLAQRHEPALYGPLLCALHTGMRRGEILGLEWEAVGPRQIAVERAWVRSQSRVPKSGKARDIPISGPLGAHLDELRAEVRKRDAWRDLGPVFTNPDEKRWDESKFAKAWLRLGKHAVEARVRPLHFHCARHTFASWALAAGQSIKWVQAMLGHSSAELTLRTYAHLMPSTGDEMGWLEATAPATTLSSPGVSRKTRRKSAE